MQNIDLILLLHFIFFFFINQIMAAVQWVYSSGQSWLSLDRQAQSQIEKLWSMDQANWILSDAFSGPVYVDTTQMLLMYEGYSYTIARRQIDMSSDS